MGRIVTDSADFPLFDIWAESRCCGRPIWVIESYGRQVLVLSELNSQGLSSFLPLPLFFRRKKPLPTQSVIDWNGDLIGFFLPASIFGQIMAEYCEVCFSNPVGLLSLFFRSTWQCFLEGSDREVAKLERDHLRFAGEISFQLKLLVLAAMTRAVGQPKVQANCFPFLR
uniref:CheW-like domain-containing protein n=1 Tax=Angiostrongylus cantonensis TaxID=6313 RepID=A0A0K0D9W3_ANGCA